MALIDSDNETTNQTSLEYYQDELKNSRVLLFELNKAILAILKGGHHSYQINTGQNSQNVTRENINDVINQRDCLLYQISQLENMLGIRAVVKHVVPGW